MDEHGEPLLRIPEAARRVRLTRGVSVSAGTLRRWLVHGIRTGSGLVRCGGRRIAGRWYTTSREVDAFLDQIQAAALPPFRSTPFLPRELAAA
jgi:hypothetical protein